MKAHAQRRAGDAIVVFPLRRATDERLSDLNAIVAARLTRLQRATALIDSLGLTILDASPARDHRNARVEIMWEIALDSLFPHALPRVIRPGETHYLENRFGVEICWVRAHPVALARGC